MPEMCTCLPIMEGSMKMALTRVLNVHRAAGDLAQGTQTPFRNTAALPHGGAQGAATNHRQPHRMAQKEELVVTLQREERP